jgi:hypothetical protein
MKDINEQIIEAGLNNTNAYLKKFLSLEEDVINNLKNYDGLQTEIYMHHEKLETEQIQFATIFSDFISLYMGNSSVNDSHISILNESSEFFRERQVTIPASLSNEINPQFQQLTAAYVHHNTEDIKSTIKSYSPLFTSSRSILRPVRALLVKNPVSMLGQPDNLIYYADGNTSNDHWYLKDSFARNSLPIPHYLDNYKIQSLFNLVLPYFRNIKMETLVKILDEESDTLSPLRRELKRIVLNYAENDLEEVRQNILRPEIDTINRKFKNYKSAHKLRIVGSVGLFQMKTFLILYQV